MNVDKNGKSLKNTSQTRLETHNQHVVTSDIYGIIIDVNFRYIRQITPVKYLEIKILKYGFNTTCSTHTSVHHYF